MIKYLKTAGLKNKTVLVRGSLDLPEDPKTGTIEDDFRLEGFVPTIQLLLSQKNQVIICGKLGRPEGEVQKKLTLQPVAKDLARLLKLPFVATEGKHPEKKGMHVVFYTGDIREKEHRQNVVDLSKSHVVVLENLEFYTGELDNDPGFADDLSVIAEVYVNDDFSKCHHGVASNMGVAKLLPSYAGLALEKEIKALTLVLQKSRSPLVLMMGGIKISDKIATLKNLGEKADKILLGGGLASLVFLSKGFEVGISKVEKEALDTAFTMEKNFKGKLILPVDVVVADKAMSKGSVRVCKPFEVGKNEQILDIGPKTILLFAKELKDAKTIVWNGPMGRFEMSPFHHGTMALVRLVGGRGLGHAYVVVGGGDTVEAVIRAHQLKHIDHVSTGGGAMLEFLAGKKLPALEVLM